MRSLVAERVAAGERQAERFLVAGRVTAGERHLAAIPPFAAVVPRLSELFEGQAGRGSRCH